MVRNFALSALLATAALAKPIQQNNPNEKRVLIVDTVFDVVYATVFVTEGRAAATTTAAAAAAAVTEAHVANVGKQHKHHSHAPTTLSSVASAPEPTQPAASSSKSVAPIVPSTTTSASSSEATTYQELVLLHHNIHRANHSAPNIAWSNNLASIAGEWASACNFEHNTKIGGGGYGQNIAAGVQPLDIGDVLTDMMYNGEMPHYADFYGMANPDFTNFDLYGHFTQIVWKGTTEVGCATVHCNSEVANTGDSTAPYMTVCNYSPPGNMGGEYGDNVGSPKGESTIEGTYTA